MTTPHTSAVIRELVCGHRCQDPKNSFSGAGRNLLPDIWTHINQEWGGRDSTLINWKGFLCHLASLQSVTFCIFSRFQSFGLVFRYSVDITITLILGKMILDGPPDLDRVRSSRFCRYAMFLQRESDVSFKERIQDSGCYVP